MTTDLRGDPVKAADETGPYEVTAAIIPDRSSRAEVPGQQVIEAYRMLVSPDIPDVDAWSRVVWNGDDWDLVAPPDMHFGSRHTKHWTLTIRRRTPGGS